MMRKSAVIDQADDPKLVIALLAAGAGSRLGGGRPLSDRADRFLDLLLQSDGQATARPPQVDRFDWLGTDA